MRQWTSAARSSRWSGSGWSDGCRRKSIEAGGVARDVDLVSADHELDDVIDDAYRAKYSYFPTGLNHIMEPQARSTTLKLMPRS
jgi:hypothetical protein